MAATSPAGNVLVPVTSKGADNVFTCSTSGAKQGKEELPLPLNSMECAEPSLAYGSPGAATGRAALSAPPGAEPSPRGTKGQGLLLQAQAGVQRVKDPHLWHIFAILL